MNLKKETMRKSKTNSQTNFELINMFLKSGRGAVLMFLPGKNKIQKETHFCEQKI